ncbi:MAG: hypothetical protein A2W91_03975 [Bacteroidetes bacterium GWF2_38_335]|nr:MAG: hypothetical protein A2W91_03975 [Bacteroidetes bacterium GWF2_38_335]OFY79109.1 MAG: hypothetical protein A2281_03310 [Bacteroidetes bacterium RIFOXYA12_FULL_38_20]HBS88805.1 hypothetical protein [Bacteroidales bacterium]
MRILIGIDDTDNLDSRGTGFRSRMLGECIRENGVGLVRSITRHQLFFDSRIPYTSHNSSACLLVESDDMEKLIPVCRDFLLRDCAPGSDAGLCVCPWDKVPNEIVQWGKDAKHIVLKKHDCYSLAEKFNVFLEGLTGTKDGVIGSLAAAGLRKAGDDGRCLWLLGKELRELKGVYVIEELKRISGFETVLSVKGEEINNSESVDLGEWVRPVMRNNKPTLIVEEDKKNEKCKWKCVSKDMVKSLSD